MSEQSQPSTTGRITHVLRKLTGRRPWATIILTTDDTDRLSFDIAATEYRHVCDVIVEGLVVTVTSAPSVAGRRPRLLSLYAPQPAVPAGDPFPLYEEGPFWEVVEPTGDGETWYQLDEQPQRDSRTEAAADLAALRVELPETSLAIRQVFERWRARCVSCGEAADQEDYVFSSYEEAAAVLEEPEVDGTVPFVWLAPDRPICAGHPAAAVRTRVRPPEDRTSTANPVEPDPDPDQLALLGDGNIQYGAVGGGALS